MTYSKNWKFVYKFYPPVLRVLEALRLHRGRQDYHVGQLRNIQDVPKIKKFLFGKKFELSILAWKDTDEILSMRKVDKEIFQYHVRIYKDGEVKGHYEYSAEGSPWRHIRASFFKQKKQYFQDLLSKYLE